MGYGKRGEEERGGPLSHRNPSSSSFGLHLCVARGLSPFLPFPFGVSPGEGEGEKGSPAAAAAAATPTPL